MIDGLRLGLTTLTVLPLRGPRSPSRSDARVAMSTAPAVGVLIGLAVAGVGLALTAVGATALVAAVVAVGASAVFTRGLHLDGLADTVDGLGSYRDAKGTLAIMRQPDVGPFGVVALVIVLVAQIAAAAVLLERDWPAAAAGIVAATAAGRIGIALGCRRGVPAARPDGLGALVAGTVGWPAWAVGVVAVAIIAVPAVPGHPWQGPLAVGLGLAGAWLLRRHVVRRVGGITGDVLGALCEASVTVTYVVASM